MQETITVLHRRLRVVTPIPAEARVEMISTQGFRFIPDHLYAEVDLNGEGKPHIVKLYGFGEMNGRTGRTDYVFDWNTDEHKSYEDEPPALLIEHAKALLARDWSEAR